MPLARSRAVVAALVFVLGGCNGIGTTATPTSAASSSAPAAVLWPAPSNPMELARAAGLQPETSEHLQYHVHAHLDVFIDGKPVQVPAGIGIDITDPMVHSGPEPDGSTSYGGITEPCAKPCISPLHTHAAHGILHTESATRTPNTLGQFFTEWGVPLTASCVGERCAPEKIAIYVNGAPHTGDPTAIELADHAEIAIVIGTPPAQIPATADFDQN